MKPQPQLMVVTANLSDEKGQVAQSPLLAANAVVKSPTLSAVRPNSSRRMSVSLTQRSRSKNGRTEQQPGANVEPEMIGLHNSPRIGDT